MNCPYCNVPANLIGSAVFYGGRDYGKIYLCSNYPQCDARVGAHSHNGKPLGTMARFALRELRKACHAKLDPLWKDGIMSRTETYAFLQKLMRLVSADDAHIAKFDERRCEEFLRRFDCPTCVQGIKTGQDYGPGHDGSSACRNYRVMGHGAIAAGGTTAHCTCAGCF